LASYGFFVIAPNYHDGSCEYTEGSLIDGKRKQIVYNTDHEVNDYEFRHEGLVIRTKEARALIDEVCMPDFASKIFTTCGFKNAKIDNSKLIACGHSFGAITSLSV
jgi:hypothetical protein